MRQSLQVLRRRWLLTSILLLLTFAGTALIAMKPGPYETASQVVFLPSVQASRPNGGNPYMSFGQSLTLTSNLVGIEVMDPRIGQDLANQGYTGAYEVVEDPNTASPVLDVTVLGTTKAVTESTLRAVTAEIGQLLIKLQAKVRRPDRITSQIVSYQPEAKLAVSKKARPIVVVLGLGLVLSIMIPLAFDTVVVRRRARQRQHDLERRRRAAEDLEVRV